jgi:hypothetical protein
MAQKKILVEHLEHFVNPRPANVEYEIRIGSKVAGTYRPGVDRVTFDRIIERVKDAAIVDTNIETSEWYQFVDNSWSPTGTGQRYRTRTQFDTSMCSMSSTTVCKTSSFTACAPCNENLACLVCVSNETPIDVSKISMHPTNSTSLSIRKRFTFTFPMHDATLFLDCTLRWFGDNIRACEKLYEDSSEPQRSIELEIDSLGRLKHETIASVVEHLIAC